MVRGNVDLRRGGATVEDDRGVITASIVGREIEWTIEPGRGMVRGDVDLRRGGAMVRDGTMLEGDGRAIGGTIGVAT